MITVEIREILNSAEIMQRLSKRPFKGKIAFQIARILRYIDEELKSFNETRSKLIKIYGERNDAGELIIDENNNYKIQPDKIAKLNQEIEELLNTSIQINADKINISDIENEDFTPADILLLEPFIEE